MNFYAKGRFFLLEKMKLISDNSPKKPAHSFDIHDPRDFRSQVYELQHQTKEQLRRPAAVSQIWKKWDWI